MTALSSSAELSANIRLAVPTDVPHVLNLVTALADYEQLSHEVAGTPAALYEHLFGKQPCITAMVAEVEQQVVGFTLFFANYSTLITHPGLYLEDLFVLPDYRGQGIGKALLMALAKFAQAHDYRRLEWSVLDWNEPAIGFYLRIGAALIEDARICRVTGKGLQPLSRRASVATVRLRSAAPAEFEQVFALVKANIEFDNNLEQFTGSRAALSAHLTQGAVEAIVAEQSGQIVGIALFCTTYSTFLTQPGLYIEDLFVLPEARGQGIGTALLADLAQRVIDRNYGRLEWRVRIWNQPAIDFYQRMGAAVLPDWRVCQLSQSAIQQLVGE
jgi:GNAT superfamily N-acetyltransferase